MVERKSFQAALISYATPMSIVAAVAALIKLYYSSANSEQLGWILGPVAFVCSLVSGISFVQEPGVGWISTGYQVAIVPGCAGINFFVICFCMSACQMIFALGMRRRLNVGRLIFLLAGAWCYTIIANSMRIWLSILAYQGDIYTGGLTQAVVHRIVGVGVYYVFLFFYYRLVSFMLGWSGVAEKDGKRIFGGNRILCFSLPLLWYILISLGVPFLNSAYRQQPDRFVAHAQVVVGGSVMLTLFLLLVSVVVKRMKMPEWFSGIWSGGRMKYDGKTENSCCRG